MQDDAIDLTGTFECNAREGLGEDITFLQSRGDVLYARVIVFTSSFVGKGLRYAVMFGEMPESNTVAGLDD